MGRNMIRMKSYVNTSLNFLVLAILVSCTTTSTVVLLPESDGHVGTVTVNNEGGTSTISKENESLEISSSKAAPGESRILDQEELTREYGEMLAELPELPISFSFYFVTDTSKPIAGYEKILDNILAEIKRRDTRDISLNGHTDTLGAADINMKLSLERAQSIRALLVENGIDGDYIKVEYFGEKDPAVPTRDNVSEPRNRRVEVVVR